MSYQRRSGNATVDTEAVNMPAQTFVDEATNVLSAFGGLEVLILKQGMAVTNATVKNIANFATSIPSGVTVDLSNSTTLASADLSILTSIGGTLILNTATSLAAIDLTNLGSLSGVLSLGGGVPLTSLSLPNLTDLSGSLFLSSITGLGSISFDSLNTFGGTIDLTSSGNGMMGLFFPNLVTFGGTITLTSAQLNGFSAPKLTGWGGACDFSQTNGNLATVDLRALTSLANLPSVNSMALVSLNLAGLNGLDADLLLNSCSSLTDLSLPTFTSIEHILDLSNTGAVTLVTHAIEHIDGSLLLAAANLIDGFAALFDCAGTLTCPGLTSITTATFPALTSVAGSLSVTGSIGIITQNCPVLASIAGTMDLSYNQINGFSFNGLTTLAGTLRLNNNVATYATFTGLTSITGHLSLDSNLFGGANSPTFNSLATLNGTLSIRNAFDGVSIDAFFVALAATITSGTGTVDTTTDGATAAPTSMSDDARAFLTGLGITVTHD